MSWVKRYWQLLFEFKLKQVAATYWRLVFADIAFGIRRRPQHKIVFKSAIVGRWRQFTLKSEDIYSGDLVYMLGHDEASRLQDPIMLVEVQPGLWIGHSTPYLKFYFREITIVTWEVLEV